MHIYASLPADICGFNYPISSSTKTIRCRQQSWRNCEMQMPISHVCTTIVCTVSSLHGTKSWTEASVYSPCLLGYLVFGSAAYTPPPTPTHCTDWYRTYVVEVDRTRMDPPPYLSELVCPKADAKKCRFG